VREPAGNGSTAEGLDARDAAVEVGVAEGVGCLGLLKVVAVALAVAGLDVFFLWIRGVGGGRGLMFYGGSFGRERSILMLGRLRADHRRAIGIRSTVTRRFGP